ncbi:MAG: RHS repeat-associated core domain-containing protein [Candidatus Sulfotelmatobacter sp.]
MAYAPYGEVYNFISGAGGDWMFTGDVTQLDSEYLWDTPNREFAINQGRWLSPDPAGTGWNQYAYPTNPLSYVDPSGLYCAYLNDAGDDSESIDSNSDEGECASNGGYWIQGDYGAGSWVRANADTGIVTGLGYDSSGNAEISFAGAQGSNAWGAWTQTFNIVAVSSAANNGPQQPQQQQPQQSRLNQASKAALHTFVFGQAIGTGVGCGVGLLVAGGATAATETYPLAGATLPAGCIGGGMIGFFEALPYSTLGAIADFGWTYWGH